MQPPYPHNPSYAARNDTVPTPSSSYYQTAYDGNRTYMRNPDTAAREYASIPEPPVSYVASWFDYSNPSYVKGLLIGAGATLLISNPTVQTAVVRGAVSVWSTIVGGIEEIKERVRDARAEKSLT